MKHLFVVTHPQASHHIDGTVGGQNNNSALTGIGGLRASKIAKHLRMLIPSSTPLSNISLTTSDLKRCLETSEIIGSKFGNIKITRTSDLREISYGEAEGKPQSWLDERYIFPPANGNDDRLDHDFGIKGAETRKQVAERVYKAMYNYVFPAFERGEEEDMYQIIVTHGFTLTFVIAAWIGMPMEYVGYIGVESTSGGISYLMQDDKFHNRSIVSVNETGHLK